MKALVVVDYQVDFVSGSLGSEDARSIEDAICERIDDALADGCRLIFTLDTHHRDYLDTYEGKNLPVPHCIEGTEGHRLYGKVEQYLGKGIVLEKSSFGCPELIGNLRDCDEVELCGVATNICVLANAVMVRSFYPNIKVSVIRSCCASYDRDAAEKALAILPSLQVDVV